MAGDSAIVDDVEVLTSNSSNFAEAERIGADPALYIPDWLRKTARIWMFTQLFLLPVLFGGVHPTVYAPAHIVSFLLVACMLALAPRGVQRTLSGDSSKLVILCLGALLIYCVALHTLRSLSGSPHPIIDSAGVGDTTYAFWTSFRHLAFFACSFFAVRTYLSSYNALPGRLITGVVGIGFLVSLIALSHWFYDTGKLFWMFEPNNVFTSNRARWPFVNSNHLGHFLIPLFFFVLGLVYFAFDSLSDSKSHIPSRKRKSLIRLASSEAVQGKLIRLVMYLTALISITLSIFGSLSRSSWLGVSVGVAFFLILDRISRKQTPPQVIPVRMAPEEGSQRDRRRRRRRNKFERDRDNVSRDEFLRACGRFAKPAIAIFALILFSIFLSGQGAELVEGRIEYGLMHSKDDMRWQLFTDTLWMIKESPWFGVGLAGWATHYTRYMSPLLSGINPVYLHSDPIQALAELGIIGVLPLLMIGLSVLFLGVRALLRFSQYEQSFSSHSRRDKILLMSLLSGLLGLMVASFLDFPFRIPALMYELALLLAITTFCIDRLGRKRPTENSQ